jgi:GDP-L-fucose synthase
MEKQSKIYIAGHRGLVGSAIVNNLTLKGYTNLIFKTHAELNLTNQLEVEKFFSIENPEYVILAAAKVGGIIANNTYRADFIYENMMIQNNVIHQSYLHGVKKLLFLGSTCIYPKNAHQPMSEDSLLTSTLEYTNEPYAIAKIAGIKMCESYNLQYGTNFISVMPTNLYGPNDNFDLEKSHVLPALLRKIHLGKCLENKDWKSIKADLDKNPIDEINGASSNEDILEILAKYGVKENIIDIWGSGKPKREFLWSEDMADACVFLLENRDFEHTFSDLEHEVKNTHINIGTGIDISIMELAKQMKITIGYKGSFNFDISKPDGTMRKLTNVSKLHGLGWKHTVSLNKGVKKMYAWYLS